MSGKKPKVTKAETVLINGLVNGFMEKEFPDDTETLSHRVSELEKAKRTLESEYVQTQAILEAVGDILDGKEPSDFMMSFGIVRKAWDAFAQKEE